MSTNTTDQLVADIERLREHLSIKNWLVVGISWGVTLGIVYAQRFPQRVRAMVLAGVTTGTHREILWITRDVGRIFPQEWERFTALIPENKRSGNLATAYAQLQGFLIKIAGGGRSPTFVVTTKQNHDYDSLPV